jgi:hypothetical protein
MTAHIHTLDALFNALTLKSLINANAGYLDAAETYMRLAVQGTKPMPVCDGNARRDEESFSRRFRPSGEHR